MADFNWQRYLTGGAAGRPDSISGMQPQFRDALQQMIASAPANVQSQLQITSGFRSPQTQAQILEQSLGKRLGPDAVAKWQGYVAANNGDVVAAGQAARPWLKSEGITKWVAPPGGSNHQKGDAADFKYLDPSATQWAHDNAPKYGLNFPLSNEDWHVEPAGLRNGGAPAASTPDQMMAQVQAKTADPVADVMAAAGNPTMGFASAPTDLTATPAPTPDASPTTQPSILGINVPKGLPDLLKFSASAIAAGTPQPTDDSTPRGGLLQSQPLQNFQAAANVAPTPVLKPWEQQIMNMFSRGVV
ncbi:MULTISPECIES: M15 family metallopeptidase [unclassified Rhizobium]|uniref:M15 family metallopeptidase n=1 Tax=unclassified Rhizobium TaxID=2613769 RepID=UPI00116015AF|nr:MULTISPECIES: M15 family metallopeptidase [unclassified Rhizobium]TQX87148.1 hypothetical protein EQW76_14915 [Rhizobium sp. rho-13.1]TQY14229.1 hypothetical protein EQW74_13705 [Rhizobium sp. rho-1.1]